MAITILNRLSSQVLLLVPVRVFVEYHAYIGTDMDHAVYSGMLYN